MEYLSRYRPWLAFLFGALLVGGLIFLIAPPRDFPVGKVVVIERGSSVGQIAGELADEQIVAHSTVLKLLLRLSGASGRVRAGAYLFNTRESALTVAYRLATGSSHIAPVQLTFPEGITVREIAEKVTAALPAISKNDLLSAGKQYEGYLFPDTYTFLPDADATSTIEMMRANFDTKITPLSDEIRTSGKPLGDIITLASLIEKEARTDADRRIVAGILWNRIAAKMPLQVDAVFGYIYDRDTYSPSLTDLSVDSLYNTYTHRGLPPGPICNPGLASIVAALHPTKTSYLYYLTDKSGMMHYATTYAAHQANQKKYLQ